MADEILGSGSVVIEIDSDAADRDIDRVAASLQRTLDRASRAAGRTITNNLQRALRSVDLTARIAADTGAFRASLARLDGGEVDVTLVADLVAFRAALARISPVSVTVVPDMTGFNALVRAHPLPDVTVNVNADTDRFTAALGRMSGIAGRAGGAVGGLLRLGAVGIAAAGAAQGIAALTAALAPAAGLLAAGPAVILGYQAALGTLKFALSGVGDAFKAGLTGDAEAFEKTLENLSPKAQAAAKEVRALKPAFESLRNAVQDAAFDRVTGEITATAQALSGPLKSGLTSISTAWGQAARNVLQYVRSTDGVNNVSTVLDATGKSVTGLSAVTDDLSAGFLQVASSVAKAFGTKTSSTIVDLGNKISAFLIRIADNGQAVQWVSDAVVTFRRLGDIAANIGGIIGGVFGAADSAGAGFLTRLTDITGRVEGFVKSAAGQTAIGNIFTTLAQVGAQLGPILAEVVRQVGALAPAIGPALTTIGPAIQTLVGALGGAAQAALPDLVVALQNIAGAVVDLAPALAPTAAAFAALVRSASDLLVPLAPVASLFLQLVAPVIDIAAPLLVAAAAIVAVTKAVTFALTIVPLLSAAMTALGTAFVANPIGVVALAIIGVATAAYLLYQRFEPVREVVDAVGRALKTAFTGVVDFVSSAASAVASFVTGLPAAFSGMVASIGGFFTGLGTSILGFFTGLPATILTALTTVNATIASALASAGTAILAFFVALPAQIGNALLTLGQTLLTSFGFAVGFLVGGLVGLTIKIVEVFIALPGQIVSAVTTVGPLLLNLFVQAHVAVISAVTSFATSVAGFFAALPGRIGAALVALPGQILGVFNRAKAAATSATTSLVSSVLGFLVALPGRAASAVSSIVGGLSAVFTLARNAVVSKVTSLVSDAIRLLAALPGKAKSALGNLGSLLADAGGQLVQGLINGIKSAGGRAIQAVKDLGSSVKDGFKSAMSIFSPSRVMYALGEFVGIGLANGINSQAGRVRSTSDKLAAAITAAFRGKNVRIDDVLIAQVRATEKQLLTLAARREAIGARIKKANEFAASTAASAVQTGALSGINAGGDGVLGLTFGIEQAAAKIRKFTAQVASLAKRGLRQDLLSQIIGLGPDQGAALAGTIGKATSAQLKDLNDAQAQLTKSAKSFGATSADVLFDAGKQAGLGLLSGLKAQQTEIGQLMVKIARQMANSIRAALRIHSPSKVFHGVGVNTMRGLEGGVAARLANVRRSAVSAAVALQAPFSGPLDVSPASGSFGASRGRQNGVQGRDGGSAVTVGGARTVTNNFNISNVDSKSTADRVMARLMASVGSL